MNKPLTPNTMKPLSIKIEAYGPYTAEQTAEAFQKHCFSKGIVWGSGVSEAMYLTFHCFTISATHNDDKNKVTLCVMNRDKLRGDHYEVTLPADWKAFKTYFDEYIAFHQKPEPKEGEHWTSGSKTVGLVEHNGESSISFRLADGTQGEWSKPENHLNPSTAQEVAQYEKTRKETALLEEAKRRYPEGTKFKSAYSGYIIESTGMFQVEESGKTITNSTAGYILYKGKWAEIIKEETREQQLEKRVEKLENALIGAKRYVDVILRTTLAVEQTMGTTHPEIEDLKKVAALAEDLLKK